MFFEPLDKVYRLLSSRVTYICLKVSPKAIKHNFWSEFPRGCCSVCYVVTVLSNRPHLQRAYVVTVCDHNFIAIWRTLVTKKVKDIPLILHPHAKKYVIKGLNLKDRLAGGSWKEPSPRRTRPKWYLSGNCHVNVVWRYHVVAQWDIHSKSKSLFQPLCHVVSFHHKLMFHQLIVSRHSIYDKAHSM